MHGHEKSDRPVVPVSPPNKAGSPAAEAGEGSGLGKENAASNPRPGLRAGVSVPSALDRVRRVARQDKDVRFTALLHHVSVCRHVNAEDIAADVFVRLTAGVHPVAASMEGVAVAS
jgi:RNA-directed DNA polymerase